MRACIVFASSMVTSSRARETHHLLRLGSSQAVWETIATSARASYAKANIKQTIALYDRKFQDE